MQPLTRQILIDAYAQGERDFQEYESSGVDFSNLDLRGVTFLWCHMPYARFSKSNLEGATFLDSDVSEADFSEANLTKADFRGTKLRFANFRGTNLTDAILLRAHLRGIDLRDANLTNVTFQTNEHDVISALLFAHAGDDLEKLMFSGLIMRRLDWCWPEYDERFLTGRYSHLYRWMLEVLKLHRGFYSIAVTRLGKMHEVAV